MSTARGDEAFTLVELMVTVVILGLLAAVAIPAYTRNQKRARTVEAVMNIQRIADGQTIYCERSLDATAAWRFVNQPYFTPDNAPSSRRYPSNVALWTADPQWSEIGFSITGPHYYAYNSFASGVGPGSAYFLGRAIGNQDDDATEATFTVRGDLTTTGVIRGAMDIVAELE